MSAHASIMLNHVRDMMYQHVAEHFSKKVARDVWRGSAAGMTVAQITGLCLGGPHVQETLGQS